MNQAINPPTKGTHTMHTKTPTEQTFTNEGKTVFVITGNAEVWRATMIDGEPRHDELLHDFKGNYDKANATVIRLTMAAVTI